MSKKSKSKKKTNESQDKIVINSDKARPQVEI